MEIQGKTVQAKMLHTMSACQGYYVSCIRSAPQSLGRKPLCSGSQIAFTYMRLMKKDMSRSCLPSQPR